MREGDTEERRGRQLEDRNKEKIITVTQDVTLFLKKDIVENLLLLLSTVCCGDTVMSHVTVKNNKHKNKLSI